jgi:hypothetical protein
LLENLAVLKSIAKKRPLNEQIVGKTRAAKRLSSRREMGACGSRRLAKEEEEKEEENRRGGGARGGGKNAPVEYGGTEATTRSRRREAERPEERAREVGREEVRVARSARGKQREEVRGGAQQKKHRRDEPQAPSVSLVRTPPRQDTAEATATTSNKRSFGGRKLMFGKSATKESQSVTSLKKRGAVATTPPGEKALSPQEKARIEAQISELWATTTTKEEEKAPPSIATEADIDDAVECGVSVVIRARPSEQQASGAAKPPSPCVTIDGAVLTVREPPNNNSINGTTNNRNNPRTFGPFDAVLPAGATQEVQGRQQQ